MHADGSNPHVLLDLSDRGIGELAPLEWSPDGSYLAFSTNPGCCSTNHSSISIVAADGSGFRRITAPDGSWGPAWSPDGSRIAFIRKRHVYTMTPDGGDVRRVDGAEAEYFWIACNPVEP